MRPLNCPNFARAKERGRLARILTELRAGRPRSFGGLACLLALALLSSVAQAQSPNDLNEGSKVEWDATNEIWRLKWWARSGHTYFIQQSDNLLDAWTYVEVIESGNDSIREWGFTTTGDRFFVRLRHIDLPTVDSWTDDFDADGVSNYTELWNGTDPLRFADTDGDGMPDDWEADFGLDANDPADAAGDIDFDGLSNLSEYNTGANPYYSDSDSDGIGDGDEVHLYGTNPVAWDSDGDTIPDGWEVARGLDPLDASDAGLDPDNDGLGSLAEYQLGTFPLNPDSDGDGLPDGWEIAHGLDPLNAADANIDGDDDGLTSLQEFDQGTNPRKFSSGNNGVADGWWLQHGLDPYSDGSQDSDGDGRSDSDEFLHGTDPNAEDEAPAYPHPDDAPSQLVATENADGSYDLSWVDGSINRRRFIIQRQNENGAWETIAIVGPNTLTYHVPAPR